MPTMNLWKTLQLSLNDKIKVHLVYIMCSFQGRVTKHAGVVGCEAAAFALKGVSGTEHESAFTGQVKVIYKKKK